MGNQENLSRFSQKFGAKVYAEFKLAWQQILCKILLILASKLIIRCQMFCSLTKRTNFLKFRVPQLVNLTFDFVRFIFISLLLCFSQLILISCFSSDMMPSLSSSFSENSRSILPRSSVNTSCCLLSSSCS